MSKEERFRRFFRNGRTIIVPMDHGTVIPVAGLESPGMLIAALSEFVDGFVLNYGAALKFKTELTGKSVILRVDSGPSCLSKEDVAGAYSVFSVDDAEAVGAGAVMKMCHPGHPNEAAIVQDCAALISDCREADMPVMLEAVPYGVDRPGDYTSENIMFCTRLAAELGADLVNTAYPGDKDAFRLACEDTFVPVVVKGGKSVSSEALVRTVADAMEAGAAGITIGRSLWQHSHPLNLAECLYRVVHERMSADEALEASNI